MEKYVVDITDDALADMDALYEHIAKKLQAPENAMGQYNRIADAILTLESFLDAFIANQIKTRFGITFILLFIWRTI